MLNELLTLAQRRSVLALLLSASVLGCTPASSSNPAVPEAEPESKPAPEGPVRESRNDKAMNQAPKFSWPEGKKAAVSLTYDDAIPSQRKNAVPALKAHGFRGTFFLTGKSDDLKEHREDWAQLVAAGHELAAHTIKHPCDRKFDWVPQGDAIQDYDMARMEAELEENRSLLVGLGAQEPFTFAYPCGETQLGEPRVSYEPLIDRLFLSARGVEGRLSQPAADDLNRVPAIDGAKPKEELLALVDRAEEEGAWLVLFFHGVGGDYLSVELAAHEALLSTLEARSSSVWTAPFSEVSAYIKEKRP